MDRQGAGQGDALLLAAGELPRQTVGVGVEPHQAQHLRPRALSIAARSMRRISSPKATLRAIVRCGNSA